MKTSDFDYSLPPERIAQEPVEPRDASRLMVLERASGNMQHTYFHAIGDFLRGGDVLVVNRSRVVPARLYARKLPGGGKVELLLLERLAPQTWKVLVGGQGLGQGKQVELENGTVATIEQELSGAQRIVGFARPLGPELDAIGKVPLPPYIHKPISAIDRYQTVYAREPGSAAAPTAGLHFTPELIQKLKDGGVQLAELTLHIGLDTFAPVNEESPQRHEMHTEWCQLSAEAAAQINSARQAGGRVIAVGTTAVRVLETAVDARGRLRPFEGRTRLFILPGYQFRGVDALITNFHLPRSTLLMLVSAFAGRDLILETYRQAIALDYRFYSFGDAMLIV